MASRALGLALALLALLPAASAAAPSASALQQALEESLASQPGSPGMIAAVDRGRFHWAGAAGVLDRDSGLPLRPNEGYRIASITKTFTAEAILRLVEQSKVKLGASVERYLPAAYLKALRADGYNKRAMTIRTLLGHTSGLFDYGLSDEYQQAVLANPDHRWTRLEQVRFAMSAGDPLSAPGREYHYADTGYICSGRSSSRRPGCARRPPTAGCFASAASGCGPRTSRASSESRAERGGRRTSTSARSTRSVCSTRRTTSTEEAGS